MQLPTKYSTGCKNIDELLGGGFESGTVTQLYGEAGSGKTNICLQVAVDCARKGESVIFIDSEGFSPERFLQIASSKPLLSLSGKPLQGLRGRGAEPHTRERGPSPRFRGGRGEAPTWGGAPHKKVCLVVV